MQRKWIHLGKKKQVSEDYIQCYECYNIYYYVKLNKHRLSLTPKNGFFQPNNLQNSYFQVLHNEQLCSMKVNAG